MNLIKEMRAKRERFDRLRNFVIHRGEDRYKLKDVLPFPISVHSVIKREEEETEQLMNKLLELGPADGHSMEVVRSEGQICDRMAQLALAGVRRRHSHRWWQRIYLEWQEHGVARRWYPFASESL